MDKLRFEDLPEAVSRLLACMENIQRLLEGTVPKEEAEELMDVRQAAEFLKLSIPTIYSKVCRGEIPAYKPGRRLYFDRKALIENVRSVTRQASSIRLLDNESLDTEKRRANRWSRSSDPKDQG